MMVHSGTHPRLLSKRWFKVIAVVSVVAVLCGVYAMWQLTYPASRGAELVPFTVETGQGVKQIGQELKSRSLIRSRFWFEIWVWLTRTESSFIAGEYQVPHNVSVMNVVRLLTGAVKPNDEVTIRVLEGWTIEQTAQYLASIDFVSVDDFRAATSSPIGIAQVLSQADVSVADSKPTSATLEGYLFPDTYRFFRAASSVDVAAKMVANLEVKFPADWRERVEARGYTVHDALTLASIVEREVATDEDRALVADIFLRRLAAGRGLEADSTINYITGKQTLAVEAEDLAIDSPYNTYRYKGLPPGPIANPSQSAIRAVVFPRVNNYWYFLTTPEGELIYSRTFDEHRAAKLKYLR